MSLMHLHANHIFHKVIDSRFECKNGLSLDGCLAADVMVIFFTQRPNRLDLNLK